MTKTLSPKIHAQIKARMRRAVEVGEAAGQILSRYVGKLPTYDRKANEIDLVTVADRESEALILESLKVSFRDDLVLAEESDGLTGSEARREEILGAEFAWCIDPLDGTTNFVHGYPAFAVSIGLLHEGQPVAGLVHAPLLGEVFMGGVGLPATRNGAQIRVSEVQDLGGALIVTGFPYDRRERLDALLGELKLMIQRAHGIRRGGCAALDLCYVACGRFDAYYEPGLRPWDLAAGHAIVKAAGGRLTGYSGAPHDIFAARTVASNRHIHDEVIGVLAEASRD